MSAKLMQRLSKRNKVTGNEPGALMNQLIEGMLPVGSRLAPVDGAGVARDVGPIQRNVFAITLHRQLLQIGRKPLQVLLIGQDRHGLSAETVDIPDGQEPHEDREI